MGATENRRITEAVFLGAAIGDAFGVPYEFLSRQEVRKVFISEMVGEDTGIPFKSQWSALIPAGSFSDDTSMLIAAASAIAEKGGEIDYRKIMQNFTEWWSEGRFCSLAFPFGLGRTVGNALQWFAHGMEPLSCGGTQVRDNGNGALMRILPFSLYAVFRGMTREETVKLVENGSRLTHGHEISFMGCCIFTLFLKECLAGHDKARALASIQSEDFSRFYRPETMAEYSRLLTEPCENWQEEWIGETGYVADTLMGAIYSIMKTDCFEDAVCMAVNLGYDTDTTACVTGQLAAALYGAEGIPRRWLDNLRKREELVELADRFASAVTPADPETGTTQAAEEDSAAFQLKMDRETVDAQNLHRKTASCWGMRPEEVERAKLEAMLEIGRVDSGSSLFAHAARRKPEARKLTLVIGLGGSGAEVLRQIKTAVDRELEPEDLLRVRYLAVDSDPAGLQMSKQLGAETIDISVSGARGRIFPKERPAFFRNFVPEDYCDADCCRSRLTGKIGLYSRTGQKCKDELLRESIAGLFAGEWSHFPELPVDILIVAGLGGDTGSGVFLDLAVQARHACPAERPTAVYGYFMLPDTARKFITTRAVWNRTCRNGFAALKELESFMSMGFETERRELFPSQSAFGDVEISAGQRIYDYPILISGSYDRAVKVIAGSIAGSLVEDDAQVQSALFSNSASIARACMCDQLLFADGRMNAAFCPEDSHSYIAIGYARAAMPWTVIIPCLVSRVMRKMLAVGVLDAIPDSRKEPFTSIFTVLMDYYAKAGSPLEELAGEAFAVSADQPGAISLFSDAESLSWVRSFIERKLENVNINGAVEKLAEDMALHEDVWASEETGRVRRHLDELLGQICGVGSRAGESDGHALTVEAYIEEMLRDISPDEQAGRVSRWVDDLMNRLEKAGKTCLQIREGSKHRTFRHLSFPRKVLEGPYGSLVKEAVRRRFGETVFISEGDEIVYHEYGMAVGLCDLAGLGEWEDGYEAAATASMHLHNGETARLHMKTGVSQYKELTKTETDKESGRYSFNNRTKDEDETLFGTGLSWLHYPSVNTLRYQNGLGSRENTVEARYWRDIFAPRIEKALALGVIECERTGDRYKYYLNIIPDDWDDLDVEDYRTGNEAGVFLRGKPLFDYLKTRNRASSSQYRRQIALQGSPAFGRDGFDFGQVHDERAWSGEKIEDTHRLLMMRVMRKATDLYQTMEDTLCRYYCVEQALKRREEEMAERERARKFLDFLLVGVIDTDAEGREWSVRTSWEGASENLVTLSIKFKLSASPLQKVLLRNGLKLAVVYEKYWELLQKGRLDEAGLETIRLALIEKMPDADLERLLESRLTLLTGEMKAFADGFGTQDDRPEDILRAYGLENRERASVERFLTLYRAAKVVLAEVG